METQDRNELMGLLQSMAPNAGGSATLASKSLAMMGRTISSTPGDDEFDDDDGQQAASGWGDPASDDLSKMDDEPNEDRVYEILNQRFAKSFVYTAVDSSILVAMNPCKPVPRLYSASVLDAHTGAGAKQSHDQPLSPHIFGLAHRAFVRLRDTGRSQSLLMSGESGAGKTEAMKLVLHYLAAVTAGHSAVEQKLMESTPILEALGNATTVRNPNSSRFGKYIEVFFGGGGPSGLEFSANPRITGASIESYLLERKRVVRVAPGERNFHVFYQLLAGAGADLRSQLGLDDTDPQAYRLLRPVDPPPRPAAPRSNNRGSKLVTSASADAAAESEPAPGPPSPEQLAQRRDRDINEFDELLTALGCFDLSPTAQLEVWRVLAAILHLGNVEFVQGSVDGNDAALVDPASRDALSKASAALGLGDIPVDQDPDPDCVLQRALTTRDIKVAGSLITTPHPTVDVAAGVRDAICMALYGRLFDWLIGVINTALLPTSALDPSTTNTAAGGSGSGSGVHLPKSRRSHAPLGPGRVPLSSVSVLDIFGFECFPVNRLEQLLINFCNERLHQMFLHEVIASEQKEYEKENIKWESISFLDNNDTIALIEAKRTGVLPMLDEECALPKASDSTYLEKLHAMHEQSPLYSKPVMGGVKQFTLTHYANPVTYDVDGFLDSNTDQPLPTFMQAVNQATTSLLVGHLTGNSQEQQQQQSGEKKVISARFRQSLSQLMDRIRNTESSYVRCLKPNNQLDPGMMDEQLVRRQLHCTGLVAAVHVRKHGFPWRFVPSVFVRQFRPLLPAGTGDNASLDQCAEAARTALAAAADGDQLTSPSHFQCGSTKLFMSETAHTALVDAWGRAAGRHAAALQAVWRGRTVRREMARLRARVVQVQAWARMWLAVRRWRRLQRGARVAQLQWRAWLARRQLQQLRDERAEQQRLEREAAERAARLRAEQEAAKTRAEQEAAQAARQRAEEAAIEAARVRAHEEAAAAKAEALAREKAEQARRALAAAKAEAERARLAELEQVAAATAASQSAERARRETKRAEQASLRVQTTPTVVANSNSNRGSGGGGPTIEYFDDVDDDDEMDDDGFTASERRQVSERARREAEAAVELATNLAHQDLGVSPLPSTSAAGSSGSSVKKSLSAERKGTTGRFRRIMNTLRLSRTSSTTDEGKSGASRPAAASTLDKRKSGRKSAKKSTSGQQASAVAAASALRSSEEHDRKMERKASSKFTLFSPRTRRAVKEWKETKERDAALESVPEKTAVKQQKRPARPGDDVAARGGQRPGAKATLAWQGMDSGSGAGAADDDDDDFDRDAAKRMTLYDANVYKLQAFARDRFRGNPNDKTAQKLVRFSPDPIKKPLIKQPSPALTHLALLSFEDIMRCMGDIQFDKEDALRPAAGKLRGGGGGGSNTAALDDGGDGDGVGTRWEETARRIIQRALDSFSLRNELYCQLIKQLSGHPNHRALVPGWRLMVAVCATVPPSPDFLPYLRTFLQEQTKQLADQGPKLAFLYAKDSRKLAQQRAQAQGSQVSSTRQSAPSDAEFMALATRTPLTVRVHFPSAPPLPAVAVAANSDDPAVVLAPEGIGLVVDSSTTVMRAVVQLADKIGLENDDGFALYAERNDGSARLLAEHDCLCDVLRKVELMRHQTGGVERARLVFRRFWWPLNWPMPAPQSPELAISYGQAATAVFAGQFPCPVDRVSALVALRLRAEWGPCPADDETRDQVINQDSLALLLPAQHVPRPGGSAPSSSSSSSPTPPPSSSSSSVSAALVTDGTDWVKSLALAWRDVSDRVSSCHQASGMLLDEFRQWAHHGSALFTAELRREQRPCWLAVGRSGVSVLTRAQLSEVVTWSFDQILDWSAGPSIITISVGAAQKPAKFAFLTKEGYEVSKIIEMARSLLVWERAEAKRLRKKQKKAAKKAAARAAAGSADPNVSTYDPAHGSAATVDTLSEAKSRPRRESKAASRPGGGTDTLRRRAKLATGSGAQLLDTLRE